MTERCPRQSLIVCQDDGTEQVIVDSYDIASYLEKNYSTHEKSLFCPGGSNPPGHILMGLSYARFIEHWVNLDFANIIRPALLAPVGLVPVAFPTYTKSATSSAGLCFIF